MPLLWIRPEPGPRHRLCHIGTIGEAAGFDGEVAVGRVRRDGEVALSDMKVDGLRADDHQRVEMRT